mmetsp:Transcript_11851/g.20970  ORF Transcript_11851/g.20970 Transcript_11851/m.20970 type:complete len:326 (-) Transcript_11851:364-1341(-)|eukprot:CAMPEP_0197632366 /NCGR_PEP_ID=MMETSP1338-20131121/9153_1 /TAXON_ID=43686 ORGANISM="Pelagodinium beii, Strain RCC1491" /NCGR_SAMPLE_ID=MMETSP1338 /ASSEMBLY_ACC=CAM_ASM_000754 /LENGTH=325 /DNA_ID=CAMNT_0043203929 /DNA_START=90 /DNA_END=1067 /DNA_ORIENTATION=+
MSGSDPHFFHFNKHVDHEGEPLWPAWAIQWYVQLGAIAAVDIIAYLVTVKQVKLSTDPAVRAYQELLQRLCAVYVFVCVYRCIGPAQYPHRFVWWDTSLSSILVIRLMATVAETCFVAEIAKILAFCEDEIYRLDPENNSWSHKFTQGVAIAMVIIIMTAQACSNYATVTTNYLWYAIEEGCWGLAFSLGFPAFVLLTWKSWKVSTLRCCPRGLTSFTTPIFGFCMSVTSFFYALYMWITDVPTYVDLYHQQLEDSVVFLEFGEGFWDALTRRVHTRQYEDWEYATSWQTAYFSFAVWGSIVLMLAPRLDPGQDAAFQKVLVDPE